MFNFPDKTFLGLLRCSNLVHVQLLMAKNKIGGLNMEGKRDKVIRCLTRVLHLHRA